MYKKEIFKNGSQWLRFDCHLHTKADKEFKYNGEENSYLNSYVEKLKQEKISVGCITNHNKFDLEEYKNLRKKAKKKEIFILPGVELSVNDGANGIHCLVIFNPDEWLDNGNNYIQQFITESFAGKHNFENENSSSNCDLKTTLEKLNKYEKDYFIILAHCEDKSGFFKELGGGKIEGFKESELFKNSILGFQKVRTRDAIKNWKNWLGENLPAFIEGSDPKKIEEIGKGKKSFIKIGDFNFEAVKFALQEQKIRTKNEIYNYESGVFNCEQDANFIEKQIKIKNSYIKSIEFTGGKLDGQTINLSSGMNNFIGIRGSGKSSLIEIIRYALDISFSQNSADQEYKRKLVEEILGSGGKVKIIAINKNNQEFIIEKTLNHSTNIYKDGENQNINITSILKNPIYFGQKDLSNYTGNFENDLIQKFIGDKTKKIKEKIEQKQREISIQIESNKKYENISDKKESTEKKINELNLNIEEFKKHNLEKKLQTQIEFTNDKSELEKINKNLKDFKNDLQDFINKYTEIPFFENLKQYEIKDENENSEIFKKYLTVVDKIKKLFLEIEDNYKNIDENLLKTELKSVYTNFLEIYKNKEEEFAEIQRKINIPNLRPDDFMRYTREVKLQKMILNELENDDKKQKEGNKNLNNLLQELENFYLEEFNIIKEEIEKINKSQKFIELKIEYKGNKTGNQKSLENYLKTILGGTGLSKDDYEKLLQYPDCIEIYKNLENIEFGGNKLLAFKTRFLENLRSSLTFQTENKIEIFYNKKPLNEHSLGQRVSALIIFILTQKQNDIIIIDQPEDDLDNQTIYNQVIKEILQLKNETQFIFATHNANIPVLGDAEQIVICDYDEKKINTKTGSIDDKEIQKNIIDVMEGGKEAFGKRKNIYDLWNTKS